MPRDTVSIHTEFKQLREEFNIEMCLVAAAERTVQGPSRMLLSVSLLSCSPRLLPVALQLALLSLPHPPRRLLSFAEETEYYHK